MGTDTIASCGSINTLEQKIDNLEEHNKYVIERALTNADVTNKRLWVTTIILIIALIVSNVCWIYYESQWQYVSSETSFEAEQDGNFNSISDITLGDKYGSESENNK